MITPAYCAAMASSTSPFSSSLRNLVYQIKGMGFLRFILVPYLRLIPSGDRCSFLSKSAARGCEASKHLVRIRNRLGGGVRRGLRTRTVNVERTYGIHLDLIRTIAFFIIVYTFVCFFLFIHNFFSRILRVWK